MVFCRGCGNEIHETAAYCPLCGAEQIQGVIYNKNDKDNRKKSFFTKRNFIIIFINIVLLVFVLVGVQVITLDYCAKEIIIRKISAEEELKKLQAEVARKWSLNKDYVSGFKSVLVTKGADDSLSPPYYALDRKDVIPVIAIACGAELAIYFNPQYQLKQINEKIVDVSYHFDNSPVVEGGWINTDSGARSLDSLFLLGEMNNHKLLFIDFKYDKVIEAKSVSFSLDNFPYNEIVACVNDKNKNTKNEGASD